MGATPYSNCTKSYASAFETDIFDTNTKSSIELIQTFGKLKPEHLSIFWPIACPHLASMLVFLDFEYS